MDESRIEKMKNILKSPNLEYKTVVCNFDVNSPDFLKNVKESNNEIEQTIFRIALKKIRSLKNITQRNLGEITGKKTITIQGYENERLKISTEFMYLVIKKINLTKKEFIDNILFSDELIAILYTFIRTLAHENKRENETEILNFIEKTFSNIIIQLFENDNENNKIDWEKFDKKIDVKKLQNGIAFIEYLEKNNYIMSEFSKTEVIFKKEDCFYKISSEKFSEISTQVNSYIEFLLSKFKTKK